MANSFADIADAVSVAVGRPWAFVVSVAVICAAVAAGCVPAWREAVNTWGGALTGYISIVLLIVLQSTQNRDTLALHTKIDELIHASAARNEFAGIDRLTEDELRRMRGE